MSGFDSSSYRNRPFRYLAAWHTHEAFESFLRSTWVDHRSLPLNLGEFTSRVKVRNRSVFGNIHRRKAQALAQLASIQCDLQRGPNQALTILEKEISRDLEKILTQEELLWFQKSRSNWVKFGDRNTRYFHTKTIISRRRLKIEALKGEDGEWIDDPDRLKQLAVHHFQGLYSLGPVDGPLYTSHTFQALPAELVGVLDEGFDADEIRRAMFSMGPFKAPGPDGFQAIFYQKNWAIVGSSVTAFVQHILELGYSVAPVNSTHLVLITKVEHPESIHQFRPISLCNVAYKLVTKVIANRLQQFMGRLISPNQASFVPGRHIQDNIVIAQEVIHTMGRMKRRKGFMALKIDLEKAYDRVSWRFLDETLALAGIPDRLRRSIMDCVSSASIKVLWNGDATDSFSMGRGLRQGCPLSPYLFVLCIERLSHMIFDSIQNRSWVPIRLGTRGPPVSHLMFADDILLFAEASVPQMREICRILDDFSNASGQKVSPSKSVLFFSKNVQDTLRADIARVGSFTVTNSLGKYLGIPIVHGRVSRNLFQNVLSRVRARLSGWSAATLSMAGRTTLAQSVLQAIPTYSMHIMRFPVSINLELERLCRNFVWGHTQERRRIHLIRWDVITQPRLSGGLGLRRMETFNMALLGKLGWGILTRPHEFWVRVLCSKYQNRFAEDFTLIAKPPDSWLWRAIASSWNLLKDGMGWVLGNGRRVRFWEDRWVPACGLLSSVALGAISSQDQAAKVCEYVSNEGCWQWDRFSSSLSLTHSLHVSAIKPPEPNSSIPDCPYWIYSSSGEFSAASAYRFLSRVARDPREKLWRLICRFDGPQRIRQFLWLAGHGKLLTNEERVRRHLSDSALCSRCGKAVESMLHVLRDCPGAKEMWLQVLPRESRSGFFESGLHDWLLTNLSCPSPPHWAGMFGSGCWALWGWRNKDLFQAGFTRPADQGAALRRLTSLWKVEDELAYTATGHPRKAWLDVRWLAPETQFLKLNTDGASKGNPGLAGAGGLIWDEYGNWIIGFAQSIGWASSVVAELWGVYTGLQQAWRVGCRRLVLEVDSIVVKDLILGHARHGLALRTLIDGIRSMLDREWEVKVLHTYREGNVCADWLACRAVSLPVGLHVFDSVPNGLAPLLLGDVVGASIPRLVSI